MLHGQRVELGDDLTVPSGPQVGVNPVLEGGQTQLGQTGDLAVEAAMGLDVGVRMAAPHRQRVAQPECDIIGIAERRRRPIRVLERRCVDRGVVAVEGVAVALAGDHVAQDLAEVGDVRLKCRSARRCGVLAVGRLEQPVDRHRTPGSGDQDRDHAPLFRTAEREGNAVHQDLERAEHPILHGPNVPMAERRRRRLLHCDHHRSGRSRTAQHQWQRHEVTMDGLVDRSTARTREPPTTAVPGLHRSLARLGPHVAQIRGRWLVCVPALVTAWLPRGQSSPPHSPPWPVPLSLRRP